MRQIQNAASINSTQSGSAKASAKRKYGYGFAALWLLLSGFFVAKMPVRPELAGISAVFVVVFALPSFLAAVRWLGRGRGLLLLSGLGAFAVGIETFAVLTGWPYGQFYYSDKIGFKLFGVVPWTVPFAWSPLLLAAMALAARWTNQPVKQLLFGGALLVAIDLVLDPGATAQGFWIWQFSGPYYGVPLINFAGWFLSGVIGAFLFALLTRKATKQAPPVHTPPVEFLSSTFLILCFWSSVCFWMELWLPAALGVGLLVLIGKYFFQSPETLKEKS